MTTGSPGDTCRPLIDSVPAAPRLLRFRLLPAFCRMLRCGRGLAGLWLPLAALVGCIEPARQQEPVDLFGWMRPKPQESQPTPGTAEPVLTPGGGNPDQPVALALRVNVLRVRAPRGTFSRSGKVWNHLDEEALTADTSTELQRNGLRAGRGRPGDWPPIKAILEAEKGLTTSQASTTVGNGMPVFLELDPRPRDQTVFLLRPDWTLGGVTLPASTNYLRLEYTVATDTPGAIHIEVMPEIRQRRVEQPPRFTAQGYMPPQAFEPTRTFRELSFTMQMKPDEFVAIGPSPSAHQPHLMGTLLLCETVDGREYETMLFLSPVLVETAVGPMFQVPEQPPGLIRR